LTLDRDKLAKILSLLGSDKLGEVMSAARAADALISNAKTNWAEVLNRNGVADSARGVHTDNEVRALAAEHEVRRARVENEKLRETVMQLAVEINDLREQAARRLAHRILDRMKQAGQALRALAIAFDGFALVRRQLAARLRDSERRARRVVVHGLAAAGIALAMGIVAFMSLQDVAKLGGPLAQSGTMASSRQEAPEATARSNGLPAEAEQHGSVSDQPSSAAMATPESIAKSTPSDAGRAPVENMSTLSPTLPSAIAVPDQTAEAPEALSNVASPAPEERQAATSTTSPATSPTATRSPSNQQRPAEIAALVTRGDAFLSTGDIVSARLFYERAADGGDGGAALRLGATFDPGFLSRTGIGGAPSDPAQASSWYRRALDLGNSAAQEALRDLEQPRFAAPGSPSR
jgi:TPR repeat protein